MSRRGTCVAAVVFAMMALPAAAFAQDVLDLEVGDPGRRDQRAALVLDGIVDSHTAELITPGELAAKLGDVRLLLVGESHTSIEFHRGPALRDP